MKTINLNSMYGIKGQREFCLLPPINNYNTGKTLFWLIYVMERSKRMALPKSKDPRGYTNDEIKAICKERKISPAKFNKAFGVNTASYDAKTKQCYFYSCDVETALARLGHDDGRNHGFD